VAQAGLLEELEAQNVLLLQQLKHIAQLELRLDQLISQEQLRAEFNGEKEKESDVTTGGENSIIKHLKEENVSLEAQVQNLGRTME